MKKLISYTLTILLGLVLSSGSCRTDGFDTDPVDGVTINGVIWAKCNVSTSGNFTANPGDYGMLYQWNRKTAWSTTGPAGGSWDSSFPPAGWIAGNENCPFGWHTPTIGEFNSLLDNTKVKYELKTQNGSDGVLFTDLSTKKSVFFPFAGYRTEIGTLADVGFLCGYWSKTYHINNEVFLFTSTRFPTLIMDKFLCKTNYAASIRCVKN